jgi:hypothetical protein
MLNFGKSHSLLKEIEIKLRLKLFRKSSEAWKLSIRNYDINYKYLGINIIVLPKRLAVTALQIKEIIVENYFYSSR